MAAYTDTPVRQGDFYWASGMRWNSQTNVQDYALNVVNHERFRFQVNRGDQAWVDTDGTRERSELASWTTVPFGKAVTFEWDFLLEPGPVTDRVFQIHGQLHQDNSIGGSPAFAIQVQPSADKTTEVLQIDANYGTTAAGHVVRQFKNLAPFSRGVVHHIKAVVIDAQGAATGMVHVEFDHIVVLDQQNIVTGYSDAKSPSYPKFGIYAAHPTQASDKSLVAHILNPDINIAA